MLDIDNKKTWWYVSRENMMLNHYLPNLSYGYHTPEKLWSQGVHDSIEQTYHAYIAYGYEPFIDGIKACWKKVEYKNPIMKKLFGYYYAPQRYPIAYPSMINMSRDHVIYSMCAFIASGMDKDDIWKYAKRVKLSHKLGLTMNLNLWLWLRLISGKKIGQLWYVHTLMTTHFNVKWNKMLDKLTGFGDEESIVNYKPMKNKPKIIKLISSLYFPNFATKLTLNQALWVSQNEWTELIKLELSEIIPKYNIVLKMLAGVDLTDEDINEAVRYDSVTGDRWSDILNKWRSDRELIPISTLKGPYLQANQLDKDYMLALLKNI